MSSSHRLRRLGISLTLLLLAVLAGPSCTETLEHPQDAGADVSIPDYCEPNGKVCVENTLMTCRSDGSGWESTPCPSVSPYCLTYLGKAECSDNQCNSGTMDCADDGITPLSCSAAGKWVKGAVCDKTKGQLCVAGQCQNACLYEDQNKQNVGCVFYPVNLENDSVDTVGVVVSNPGKVVSRVTLSSPEKVLSAQDVLPGKLATFLINPGAFMLKGTGKSKGAFKLSATLPVAAYQFSPLNKAEQRSNDASLLLSRGALGTDYTVLTVPLTTDNKHSYVTVVGTVAGTSVTVTPSVASEAGGGLPALKAKQAYTTTLNELDLLQVATSTDKADLTGTTISSTKPVAVFVGNSCLEWPEGRLYCDHIQEQIYPVTTWGWGYLAVKSMPRGQYAEDDLWRIMAAKDDTTVTLSGGASLPQVPKLNAGAYTQISTNSSFVVKADKPISMIHLWASQQEVAPPLVKDVYTEDFQTSKGCVKNVGQTNMGDPALAYSVPFGQYRQQYLFLTPDTYRYDFVTIMVTERQYAPVVLLDGKPLTTGLTRIGATNYRYARLRLSDGPHTVSSDTPIGVEVYGYDCAVSYAYSGGLNLKAINPLK